MQICSILCYSWSILVKCCVHLRTRSSKTQMLLLEKNIFHKHWLFCYRFIPLTFDLCSLLSFVWSVIRKQQLKQCNYSVVQSALMTGFGTDMTSSVWNFCRWDADVHPREMSPAQRSVEKRLFSQANCRREAMWMAHMKCYVASRRKWQLVSRRDRRVDVHVKLRKNLLSWWEDTTKR